MIELFSSDTPNGKKVSILLEELGCVYKVTVMDLSKDDQFKTDFKKISPFSKIPVIIEPEGIKAILSGGGDRLGEIKYQKDKSLISNDSIVYSSGSGGILKAGIPIGKIIINNEKINVEFFKDFNQISFVKILSFTEEKNWHDKYLQK